MGICGRAENALRHASIAVINEVVPVRSFMQRLFLASLVCLALMGAAKSWKNLSGGNYVSPLGNYTVPIPDWPGLVVQQYNDDDFTNVAFLDQGGLLPATMWGIASLRLASEIKADVDISEQRDIVYQRFLEFFVLPHMLQNVAPKSALSHHAFVGADETRALFAVANIPEGHAFLRNPKKNKQDDSVNGLLVFHQGSFIYLIRAEMKAITNPGITPDSASDKDLEAARERMIKIRASIQYPDQ